MKVIAPDTFWGTDLLYEVSLTDNELTLTTDEDEDMKSGLTSPFAPLKFLDTLRLGGNHLQRVFADWFEMKPRGALRLLDLSRNRYTKLTKEVIFNFTADIKFYTSKPLTISVIRLDENPFRCDCELFTFIQILNKRFNSQPIFEIGNSKCASPPSLEGYSIKSLTLEQLFCPLKDADCPSNCVCYSRPATKYLDLDCSAEPMKYPEPSEFGLKEMRLTLHSPPETFAKLPDYVVFLNLSGIGLTEIPEVPETVKDLDLSNNSLTRPPMELLKNIRLRLSSNPFLCDCSHVEESHFFPKQQR
ncbi:hypothetical protein evm_014620 [Chilo suppressalis]|nr:hypothetical protein evm_014620 [Chilo suppressalis]